ncbi:hypothetical protein BC833DRAFT_600412 [Globomyces pollinis-pini]|nr:hypothetical protein BC833DRAFT_600412 [Globomyces pollinis-pini]
MCNPDSDLLQQPSSKQSSVEDLKLLPHSPVIIHDPIIDQILSTLPPAESADEIEKKQRMYLMIRHSKKYKKMQVQNANSFWDETIHLEMDDRGPSLHNTTTSEDTKTDVSKLSLVIKHVHFKDTNGIDDSDEHSTESKPTMIIKKYFGLCFNLYNRIVRQRNYGAG